MRKERLAKIICCSLLAVSMNLKVIAQVAINNSATPPDPSAMLDVSSANKGILIPRVALQSTSVAAPVVSPANSLLVYNTATAGSGTATVTPGHYYWDAAAVSWKRLNALPPELWKLNGDSIYTLYKNTGIGTASPRASAVLDITSTNKGVLLPRVALQAANVAAPVVSPANSLLVYNIATAGAGNNQVTPGHYFWDSVAVAWKRVNPELWKLNGDSIYTLYKNTGIGTASPNASAVLDVTSTNKGILIPRVALQAINTASPVVSPAHSLLVYNTATAGSGSNAVTPGHYFWDTIAVSWKRLNALPPELWKVNGDSIYTLYKNTGIGTASPKASAVLDVSSTNKGILIPRVALQAVNVSAPVVSPANSLLVYNTATAGAGNNQVTPGHYYWDTVAVSWKRVNPELWRVNGDSIYTLYKNTGIGTTSPKASAVLDVTSNNKGILIPRVALQAVNVAAPVVSPANSLLVYNTATAGAGNNQVTPGHYFWDTIAVAWKRINPELWKLSGDSIYTLYRNTGIGTASPNASAVLDVTSTNKGVLLPRVALQAANLSSPVVLPAHSLLVFNTATAGSGSNAVTPGHYFWDTSTVSWKRLNALPPELWKLSGDSIYTLYRNTGIGTASPNASAVLDVSSTNKGVLLPRVALQAINIAAPVVSPANSLLVYNTATAGSGSNAVTPGHYFWDTSAVSWKRLNALPPELWKLSGDSIYTLYRNTGIGTASPNASAVLDVTSTNKGVLLPRVALQAANVAAPVVSPAHSLLIYNTATAGSGNNAVTPGHYFWDTATVSWKRVNPELWKLSGDSIYTLYRNTGIGTASPNASAVLDVTSTNKGVLLPRVALQAANVAAPVVSPAHSLLIYNTATAGSGNNAVTPGHYFWDTATVSWKRLNAGAGAAELWKLNGDTIYTTYRNVGIGTASPDKSAKLHIKTSDSTLGFLVSGIYDTTTVGTIPVLGAGSRMLYYPGPGIFRAGKVNGNAWDPVNAGRLSVAMGSNTIASGLMSTAFGDSTKASNTYATAMGVNTLAAGVASTAMGDTTKAQGYASAAMGRKTIAKGFASSVLGMYNDSILLADQIAVTDLTPLLIVGNGSSSSLRSNAMVVRKDGNVGIGTSAPNAKFHLHVTSPDNGLLVTQSIDEQDVTSVPNLGEGSRLMFYPGKSAFRAGTVTATQWNDVNVGYVSFAGGYNNTAVGGASTAFGLENIAAGAMSMALGYNNYTNGDASLATGQLTRSDGDYSTTTGDNTIAKSYAEFVIGKNNDTLLSTVPNRFTWNPDNALLVAGNGAGPNNRHNAMVLYKNGNTDHSGYTRLGEVTTAAPRIKMKKLTGTSNVAADASVSIVHGLNAAKIISVSILMDASPTLVSVPPSYTYTAGYEYQYHITATNIVVINTASNSSSILGKAFTILITYEE